MGRHHRIALLWKKAAASGTEELGAGPVCGPSEVIDPTGTGCMPDPNAHMIPNMSWQEFKRRNPLKGDRTDQAGVPDELKDLFTEEQLGSSKSRIPKELQGLFSDTQLRGEPSTADSEEDPARPVEQQERVNTILHKGEALKKGARDSSTDGLVSRVQTLLDKYKYLQSAHGIDGVYGSETERAVLDFQKNNKNLGLIESGEVDEATLKALQGPSVKERPRGTYSASLTEEEVRRQQARGRNAPKVSGSGRVSATKLYQDLMVGIAYPNLCRAMVANAIAESALYYNNNGDCGSYAKGKGKKKSLDTSLYPDSFLKPKRGDCCSFGLWQYNICGGLGNSLLGSALNGSDEEKIAILISYDKQVQFMISYVNRKIARITSKEGRSVDYWVEWFVRKVEIPAKPDRAVAKRQQIARGLTLA